MSAPPSGPDDVRALGQPSNGHDHSSTYAYQATPQAGSSTSYQQASPAHSQASLARSPTGPLSLMGMLNDGASSQRSGSRPLVDPSLQSPRSTQIDPALVDPSLVEQTYHQQQVYYPPQADPTLQHPQHQRYDPSPQSQHLPLASPSYAYPPMPLHHQTQPSILSPPGVHAYQASPYATYNSLPPTVPSHSQPYQHPSAAPSPAASASSRGGYYDHPGSSQHGGGEPWMDDYGGWPQGGPSGQASEAGGEAMSVDGDGAAGDDYEEKVAPKKGAKKAKAPPKPKKPRAPPKGRASKAATGPPPPPQTGPNDFVADGPGEQPVKPAPAPAPAPPNKRSRSTKEAEKLAEKARRAEESDLEGPGNEVIWKGAVEAYAEQRRQRRKDVENWGEASDLAQRTTSLAHAEKAQAARLAKIDARIQQETAAHDAYLRADEEYLTKQAYRIAHPTVRRKKVQTTTTNGVGSSSRDRNSQAAGPSRGRSAVDELEGLLGDEFESESDRGGKRRRVEREGGIGDLEDELMGGRGARGVGKGNWKRPPKDDKKGKGRSHDFDSQSPYPPDSQLQQLPPGTPSQYDPYDVDLASGRSSPVAHSRGGPSYAGPEGEARRLKAMEEAQTKVWASIVKRDIPRVYRVMVDGVVQKRKEQKKVALVVQREERRAAARATKASKNDQLRSKKMMREMLMFWKRNEKDERDNRKRAEKDALDKAKKEEEMRESQRASRKLNFLLTQTELYSHFVGSKIKTAEAEESEDTAASGLPSVPAPPSAAMDELAAAEADLKELDFNEEDDANLNAHARQAALAAVAAAKAKADAFDVTAAQERKTNEALAASKTNGAAPMDLDSDELNFQNPTMAGDVSVKQPKMLTAQLKDYQLKGLNWLANLYEQGINGILADEMGLGKTIQSISLMAYLAEVHDIWGPFLVIAPASTLHNWQQEITRFVPQLKCLPYWGNVKDRATLRKFWNRKQISYNQDAPFHVLITSYQLVVSDEKYFQRVKWQYMILDEAQAIKSSTSARWKTLLGFHCRNRLLLTGTPVQNSMHELWALLHFIMPSLFDNHDEFSEWFSRDIENAAAGGDSKGGSNLNEHQLQRLHMILKPFMLRRVKKNVQNELGDKIEIDVYVNLSPRQRSLYQSLRSRISIAELMERASNTDDQDSVRSLMNLVMQFRKVCNHPQLFERADVKAPFAFADFARTPSLLRQGEVLHCPDSTHNPIELQVPRLLYEDGGIVSVPGEDSSAGSDTFWTQNMMNVWSVDWMAGSLRQSNSPFSALALFGSSPSDARRQAKQTSLQTLVNLKAEHDEAARTGPYINDSEFAICTNTAASIDPRVAPLSFGTLKGEELGLPSLTDISRSTWDHSYLSSRDARFVLPTVVAPPITSNSTSTAYTNSQAVLASDPVATRFLFGLAPSQQDDPSALSTVQHTLDLPLVQAKGLIGASRADQLPQSSMAMPEMERLIFDSAKLAKLDLLLRELKKGGHRVLLYFQMTKMLSIIEEYLVYRQYKYLRLDGNSKISDRRDMVTSWQTDPEIFVFCLSTRAGGLGINLTAADTVIFYDNDWNPSNDAQAMDRAHRLGQTRQVTVYRLITKGTIDERIVKLARQKKEVQDLVVGNKTVGDVAQTNEVLSLLLDDDELAESLARRAQADADVASAPPPANPGVPARKPRQGAKQQAQAPVKAQTVGDLWKDVDEDDFFGASKPAQVEEDDDDDVEGMEGEEGGGGKKKGRGKAAGGAAKPKKPRGPNKRKAKADAGDGF